MSLLIDYILLEDDETAELEVIGVYDYFYDFGGVENEELKNIVGSEPQ